MVGVGAWTCLRFNWCLTSRQHTGVNGLHAVALMAANLGRTGQLTDAERRTLAAALTDLAHGFAVVMRPGDAR